MRLGLTLAPKHNRPGRSDATGAFHLGTKRFRDVHGTPFEHFDNGTNDEEHNGPGQKKIRDRVFEIMRTHPGPPWDVFAYFGHGISNGLPSAGIYSSNIKALAELIRAKAKPGIVVLLYACLAGSPGGFAAKLQAALADKNARVYGHASAGRAFANADKTVHPPGHFVVAKSDALWRKWKQTINASDGNPKIDLWARFPFMSKEQLVAELNGLK